MLSAYTHLLQDYQAGNHDKEPVQLAALAAILDESQHNNPASLGSTTSEVLRLSRKSRPRLERRPKQV
jgi:hypothetical protein